LAAEPKSAVSSPSAEPSRDAPLPQQFTTSSTTSGSVRAMTSSAEGSPGAGPRVEAEEPNRPRILPVPGAIEYAPPASASGVALTSPADGFIVTPEDPPVVVVEGRVDDKSATTLWLVANGRRIAVRVSDGLFRKILPVVEPTLRVWAETSRAGEPGGRSQIVTVHTTGSRKPSGVLVMEWPRGSQDLDVEVSALWRLHPDRLDEAAQPVRLTPVLRPSAPAPLDVFWLRNLRAGVYTIIVRYRGLAQDGEVHPTLYVPDRDSLAALAVRPIRFDGAGKAILARVLLPQGVLWEQEGWFSGSSESVDTVSKFRFPEGINWVERKADLQ